MVCGRLTVRLVKVRGHGDIVERKIKVSDMENISNSTTFIVNALQLISWPKGGLPHTQSIISLMQMLTGVLMKSSSKKSVIMCRLMKTFLPFACFSYTLSPPPSDGVVRSGTFLVIHSQLERLKTEGVVDVFQTVKAACIHRPGVISNTVCCQLNLMCKNNIKTIIL